MNPANATEYVHHYPFAEELVSGIMMKLFGASVIIAIMVAVITFGFLEMFMKPGLAWRMKAKGIPASDRGGLGMAFAVMASLLIPLAIGWSTFWNISIIKGIGMMGSGLVLCWIMSFFFRKYVPDPDARNRKLLFGEAFVHIVRIVGRVIPSWIGAAFMWIVDIGVKAIHRPFIIEYTILALVFNFALSMILTTYVMGDSMTAMSANIGGSGIAAIAHSTKLWITGERRELLAKYKQEDTSGTDV